MRHHHSNPTARSNTAHRDTATHCLNGGSEDALFSYINIVTGTLSCRSPAGPLLRSVESRKIAYVMMMTLGCQTLYEYNSKLAVFRFLEKTCDGCRAAISRNSLDDFGSQSPRCS
jgi:hypothetical protein